MQTTYDIFVEKQRSETDVLDKLIQLVESKANLDIEYYHLSNSILSLSKNSLQEVSAFVAQYKLDVNLITDEIDVDGKTDKRLLKMMNDMREPFQKFKQLSCSKLSLKQGLIHFLSMYKMRSAMNKVALIHIEMFEMFESIRVMTREHDADVSPVAGNFNNADDLMTFLNR